MKASKELKKKKDEQSNELWVSVKPSAKQCRKCVNAYSDTKYTVGAEKGNCKVYEPPIDKPQDILWDEKECEFYLERKE